MTGWITSKDNASLIIFTRKDKVEYEKVIIKGKLQHLDCLFNNVSAVRRFADPLSSKVKISLALVTISSSSPLTRTPPFPSSISGNCFFCLSSTATRDISSGASKSVISSLYSSRKVTLTLYSAFCDSNVSNICFTALGMTPASGGNSPLGPLCNSEFHNI